MVNPAPMPNRHAQTSNHGLCPTSAKPSVPLPTIRQIPHTRWCRCTPLSLTTLPGHHDARGLRPIRALVRMNPKAARNATRTRKIPWRSSATRSLQNCERAEPTARASLPAARG